MKLQTFACMAIAACGMLLHGVAGDVTKHAYDCETDADCESFANTVCIIVDNDGTTVGKCTPNTKARPACRGAQPGMCPSYQSAEVGYLNVQCIFIAKDESSMETLSSGDGSSAATVKAASVTALRSRYLLSEVTMANTTTAAAAAATTKVTATTATTAAAKASSASGAADETTVGDGSTSSADDEAGPTPKDYVTVKIGSNKVTGKFECHPVSACTNLAYDTSSCLPKECGSSGSLDQCTTHGTCTYPSIQTMTKRRCMCNKGYTGDKCQTEVSGACDVDCGIGGDCVDGTCVCKKGFDGKSYKNKAGKPNRRCTKCTNDLACQNDNACDIETGSCVCSPGYSGITCGATEDACTKKDCGHGTCKLLPNMSAACYCNLCDPDCQLCPTKNCGTCPSPASRIEFSKAALFFSAVLAVLVGNVAF